MAKNKKFKVPVIALVQYEEVVYADSPEEAAALVKTLNEPYLSYGITLLSIEEVPDHLIEEIE